MPPGLGAEVIENHNALINCSIDDDLRENVKHGMVYRLGGSTCLSGDVIGDYCFEGLINMGNRVIFGDMAIYTMCKNNTFNGMPLPSIFSLKENGDLEEISSFGYEDFKVRLGK